MYIFDPLLPPLAGGSAAALPFPRASLVGTTPGLGVCMFSPTMKVSGKEIL